MEGLARIAPFEISVAAYPETHPTAASPQADLDNLKRKLDAGATRAITNYFFEAEMFLRFIDRCLAAGITTPIVPGIMPVSNFAQAVKFSAICGASVPDWVANLFAGTEDDPEIRRMVAVVMAAEQVRRAPGQRHRRIPFLHAEPAGPDLRHRPYPGRAPQGHAAAGRLNRR